MGNTKSELARANDARLKTAENDAIKERAAARKRHKLELDQWIPAYTAALSGYYATNKVALKEKILKTDEQIPIELKFEGPVPSFFEEFEYWKRSKSNGRSSADCYGHRGALYTRYYSSYRKSAEKIMGLPVRFGRLEERDKHYVLTMDLLVSEHDRDCNCWETQTPGWLTQYLGTDCSIHGETRSMI